MLPCRARARPVLTLLGLVSLSFALACRATQRRNTVEMVHSGGDVLAAGDTVRIADSVAGDAMLAGGELTFSGATGGDYVGTGGSQIITGRIHGTARAAGGAVRLAAPVDRNVTIAGGRLELDRGAVVGRNAYLAGGEIHVAGTVRQALHAAGGTVELDGQVGGDVSVSAGELRVGPRAAIAGNLRYRVPAAKVHIDPAAHIAGRVTALPPREVGGVLRFFRLLRLLGFLVAGAVVVALAPRFASEAADRLRERPGFSGLVGLAWLIVIPVAAVAVAITVIGLPLALLACGVYLVLAYIARAVLALWLGRLILGARVRTGVERAVLSFLVGAIILLVASLVPVIGPLVTLVATVFGLGALLVEMRAWGRAPAAS